MKKLFKFLPIALLGFCLVLNSCSETSIEQNVVDKANTKPSPAFLGKLHNDGLDHFMFNYNDSEAETNLPEVNATRAAEFLYSFASDKLCPSGNCNFDNYLIVNELMIPEQGIYLAMQRTKSNFDIDQIDPNYIYNIEESAEIIKSSDLL